MHIAATNADLNLELNRVTGQPGIGLHQIRLDLRATAVPPSALRGTYALVDGSMEFGSEAGFRQAGRLRAERPLVLPANEDNNVQGTLSLIWDVTPEQLETMETLRKDREPYLRANLNLHLFRPGDSRPQLAWGTENLTVDITRWATVLEQAGYAQALVLILPMPTSDSSKSWSDCVEELRKARTAAIEGRYRDAVSTARHVVELLSQVRPVELATSRDKKERTKEQRFEAIREAVEDLADAAHHNDEVTREFKWERQDAVAVVNLIASLMHWQVAGHQ